MIQRIQSLWLLMAAASAAMLFFMPLAFILNHAQEQVIVFKLSGIIATNDNTLLVSTYTLAGLTAITALLSLINIFLFKKRTLQMRISVYSAILMLALAGLIAYYLFYLFAGFNLSIRFVVFMPIIGFILLLMARRAVKRDEELVRAIDRIR